ncbi:MAG: hypothetical protein KKB50_10785 [Planctomycetes bacterium]|nr:hypothetical protein [Planctomycetota bacterium]
MRSLPAWLRISGTTILRLLAVLAGTACYEGGDEFYCGRCRRVVHIVGSIVVLGFAALLLLAAARFLWEKLG